MQVRIPQSPAIAAAVVAVAIGFGAAPALAQNAYITNQDDDTVSVINTATDKLIGSPITVGSGPYGVAVTPDRRKVYVTNAFDKTVSVIDTATDKLVGSPIPVGQTPEGVAVTPDGSKVYVGNFFDRTVSVIDTATNTIIATITGVDSPEGIAVTPNGGKVYVTNSFRNTVSAIDTATNKMIGSPIDVGKQPSGLAVTPDGGKVYVANFGNSVSVIDTAKDKVVATIAVGRAPFGVAVTPDGSKVYVTNFKADTVSVIDTATDTVIRTHILVGEKPLGVAVAADGSKVFVAEDGSNTVSVIDTATDTVIGSSIPVGRAPHAFGVFARSTIPFSSLIAGLLIKGGDNPGFTFDAVFALGTGSNGINPPAEPVTLSIGPYSATLPTGSLHRLPPPSGGATPTLSARATPRPAVYTFIGTISGVRLEADLVAFGGTWEFGAKGTPVNLAAVPNPVPVSFGIGNNIGSTSLNATRAP